MEFLDILHVEKQNKGASTGSNWLNSRGDNLSSYSPVDGNLIGTVTTTDRDSYEKIIQTAQEAFLSWRMIPAPARGDIVRQIGEALREYKEPLGKLVSYEMGKSLQEGYGEVQEMIDICDFAVGLSRQLYGLTMHSERPGHRMYEQWHPLGIVGIISAFNFPVAVWSWNAMIAARCGDCVLWRPSSETPPTCVPVQTICNRGLQRHGLKGIFNLLVGASRPIEEMLVGGRRLPALSFTGPDAW